MPSAELKAAIEAAEAAAKVIRDLYQRNLQVVTKADKSPVTEADVRSEEAIHDVLSKHFPAYGFFGEETGQHDMGAESIWLVDPIDGTKSFLRGSPPWATLLALEVDGDLVLGVASAPALGRRWWATAGGGAFADGDRISVSRVDHLADALLCHTDLLAYGYFDCGPEFDALSRAVWDRRGFGDFWGHMLVAEGIADVMLEPVVEVWDVAALIPIVTEAGGRVTDRTGVVRPDGGNVVTSNGVLHDAVLAIVGRD